MNIDTVVLDLDGTLVDSVYVHVSAWHTAFCEVGVEVPTFRIHRAIGMGGDRLVTQVAGAAVEQALGDTIRELHARHFDERFGQVTALDGAGELLEGLRDRGLNVVLASSGAPSMTDRLLELVDHADALQERISGSDAERSKPAPDLIEVAPSLVSAALDRSEDAVGGVADKRVLVVGAGAMAGLATATVARLGAAEITVANRSAERAARLAEEYGGRPASLGDLGAELGRADVVIACAGATGVLVTMEMVAAARPDLRPISIIDLALPHDVDPAVAALPGVTLINLTDLAAELHESDAGREVQEVRRIVTQEVAAFLSARRQASVTPTVVALRSMATSVVEAEMERLAGRLPDLDDASREEVLQAVRRVADKLLHQPTVRVKELVNETGAVSYAAALAELFALDPDAVDAVTRPEGLA